MNSVFKAIIVDDESLARDIIKNYAADLPGLEICAECKNGYEGIKAISEFMPDIVFLDIQMPRINGFEMLELIDDPPVIIFTTAFDNYAIKAFELSATDYLLKPFTRERFTQAVNKALTLLKDKSVWLKGLEQLKEPLPESSEKINRIVVKNGSKISVIPADSVQYLEAQDDYVMIYSRNGSFIKQKTMKFYEDNLNPEQFLRIHRSYIVNITEIKSLESPAKETYKLLLKSGTALPVSKTGYSKLKDLVLNK